MIPFLKKNKDGRKPPKSTVPRTAQESIPFQRMFEDGTCRVRPGYYTRTIQYQDINYWLIQFSTKYHLSYMGAVSELLKQLDSLHSYDLLNQYAMKSLTIAPDNPKAYCWLIRSLKAQGMNELATNELAAAKEHLTTEEYEEILAFGANW